MTMQPRPGRAIGQLPESSTGGGRTLVMLVCLAGVALSLVTLEFFASNPILPFLHVVPILLAGGVVIARPGVGANLALGVLGFWLLLVALVMLALSRAISSEFNPFTLFLILAIIVVSAVGVVAAFRAGRSTPLLMRSVLVLVGIGLQAAFLFARVAPVAYI